MCVCVCWRDILVGGGVERKKERIAVGLFRFDVATKRTGPSTIEMVTTNTISYSMTTTVLVPHTHTYTISYSLFHSLCLYSQPQPHIHIYLYTHTKRRPIPPYCSSLSYNPA